MRRVIVFLAVTAVIIMSAGLFTGCDNRERLHIFNWAYYTPQSVITAFEQEYGVRVVYTIFNSNEEMLARLMAGGGQGLFARLFGRGAGFDVVFPSGDYVAIMMRLGMLERLDHSLLPNLVHVDPEILAKALYDPTMQYSVPYFFGAAGIIVNTEMVPEFERDISIFARTDLNQGHIRRMTMLDDPRQVIGDALNYLGFSVNSRNPEEIAAARDHVINHWRPNLVQFDSDTIGQGFANGEFWVVQTWAENVFYWIGENEHLLQNSYFFFPPGASSYTDNMVILRDAPNVELAHRFINFIHRPEIYAMFVDEFGLPATVNVPARELTQVTPWYTLEELFSATDEIQDDVGPAMTYYTDAWLAIRFGIGN